MPGGVRVLVMVSRRRCNSPGPANWDFHSSHPPFCNRNHLHCRARWLRDLAGIPIPDRTWSFRTGSGIDTTPPSLLRISTPGQNVSPDAVVSFSFDKPIARTPLRSASVSLTRKAIFIRPMRCGRDVGVQRRPENRLPAPDSPLAAGATFTPRRKISWTLPETQARLTVTVSTFQIGYGGVAPVTVTGASPRPGASGCPSTPPFRSRPAPTSRSSTAS